MLLFFLLSFFIACSLLRKTRINKRFSLLVSVYNVFMRNDKHKKQTVTKKLIRTINRLLLYTSYFKKLFNYLIYVKNNALS